MIHAFILDLDGVITDTAEYHYLAWKRLADENDVHFDRSVNENLRGISRRKSLEILLGNQIDRFSEADIAEMMETKNGYYREMLTSITPADFLPGAEELLKNIRKRDLKVAIGSASRNTPMVLKKLGIADFFDAVSDGHSVVRAKPAPDVFVFAAGAMKIPVEFCAVIEDAAAGVEAANTAGMVSIGVGPKDRVGHARYRYDTTADIDLGSILEGDGSA